MRGYLQATIKECRKALASHNTGLHARATAHRARTFMGETACRKRKVVWVHPVTEMLLAIALSTTAVTSPTRAIGAGTPFATDRRAALRLACAALVSRPLASFAAADCMQVSTPTMRLHAPAHHAGAPCITRAATLCITRVQAHRALPAVHTHTISAGRPARRAATATRQAHPRIARAAATTTVARTTGRTA